MKSKTPRATSRSANPDYLNGVPELLVLQLLARRAMHGYELLRSIEESSGESLQFGEGCIYPVLHRLEKEGHLASEQVLVNGRRRIVYRTTPAGRKQLAANVSAWRQIVASVNQVLEGGKHAQPAVS